MKTSEFMDKQITELSRSNSHDFSGFDSSQEDEEDDSYGVNKDHFFPIHDFHSFPPLASSQSHPPPTVRNCSSMDRIDSAKVTREEIGTFNDSAFFSMIDQKIKEHADNLLHAVEGISARISQLESRTRHLENSVDELKESAEYNHGRTDGKLRLLESILKEVQGGVQDLRDKQEITEAQLQLAKLQVSKVNTQSEKQNNTIRSNSVQETSSSIPQQFHQQLPISINFPQPFPAVPPNSSHLPHQSPPPAAAQLPTKLPQNQVPCIPPPESYYSPLALTPETTHQQCHMSPTQQSQPPPPAPHHPYQLAPQIPQISQSNQLPQLHSPLSTVNPQVHVPLVHHPEGTSYMPFQTYHQSVYQSSSQPPSGARAPPSQQFYTAFAQQMHDTSSRPNSEFPTGFSPPPGHTDFNNLYPYRGSSSHNGSSATKPSQLSPPPQLPSGGSSYSRLPTAQILPYALPTASSVSSGSDSSGTGNRVPVDDVVDNVAAMGFRRDLVRATVKKLTENGQSVDLNVVLDKLMNDGESQPQNVRFGQ